MLTEDFDYDLPEERIAQAPMEPRDACRLLVLGRESGSIEHRVFRDIVDYLHEGDLLVANETRVLPARLLGRKAGTGGAAEVLLLRQNRPDIGDGTAIWEGLVKPGKRLKPGAVVEFFASGADVQASHPERNEGPHQDTGGGSVRPCHPERSEGSHQERDEPAAPEGLPRETPVLTAEILDWAPGGSRGERLIGLTSHVGSLQDAIHAVGRAPLPPYIRGYEGDPELYQTVYSRRESSAAAPTAGLHFTPELLDRTRAQGVGFATVELEVGLDTFRIVDEERAEDHEMHTEVYHVPQATVDAIEAAKARGGRVIAVGTTSMRSLESAWDPTLGHLRARCGESTSLFILPGYEFHVADALITNFHVPRSTLMMLVSAFSTRDNIMRAYRAAIDEGYRMLSFGDAMLIA